MHTYIHTYIHTYLHTYIHSYIHTYIHNSLTGHVSAYMFDVLPWLPLQQRIMFRIGAMVRRRILGLAPAYLRDLGCPIPGTRGRSSLRSIGYSLRMCALHVNSTNPGRSNLVC